MEDDERDSSSFIQHENLTKPVESIEHLSKFSIELNSILIDLNLS